jgi:hypothetical protein
MRPGYFPDVNIPPGIDTHAVRCNELPRGFAFRLITEYVYLPVPNVTIFHLSDACCDLVLRGNRLDIVASSDRLATTAGPPGRPSLLTQRQVITMVV